MLCLVFLTNNFVLPALIIAAIYRQRWEIGLFYHWIKQHLCLRAFFSTNSNGVEEQICTVIFLLSAGSNRQARNGVPAQFASAFENCLPLRA